MQEKAEDWPRLVKRGGVVVKIYRINNRGHPAYQVAWWQAGKRLLKYCTRYSEAHAHADEQATLLNAGQLGVARMLDTDREAFVAASGLLKPLGVPLLDAVKSYVASTQALRGHGSLLDAAKDYARRQSSSGPRKSVSEVVEELLAIRQKKREQGRASIRDVQTLRSHLRSFAAAFQKPIQSVQLRDLNEWLRANSKTAKTFNNKRTSLVRLFHFARDQGYLPQSERTAADMAKREKLGETEVATLPPSTLRTLLKDASEEAARWLTLASFTGMRTCELLRLHWQHIDFDAWVIRVPRQVAKTGTKRQIPILPNLRAWLAPYAGRVGLVFASKKASVRTVAYAKAKGIEWPKNWARHSFGTYRATITKKVGQVSLEMGNSEAIVKRHYFDQHADQKDAKEWFAIVPDRPANVVPMKGAA
jgi:integrase